MKRAGPRVILFLLAAVAFLPLLGRRDIVTSHEARVVQVAREMAYAGWPWDATRVPVPNLKLIPQENGQLKPVADPSAPPLLINPWLVPVFNDEIRLQKPPLPYWSAAVLFKLAGDWSETLVRLIPALLGFLATYLMAELARLTIGRRAALPAALVWVSSYFIADEFRKGMADPYLAFFALAATVAWMRQSVVMFYVMVALGLLAKGPVLFVHLAIPIGLWHLLRRRRWPGSFAAHLTGLALLAAIVMPWPLYVTSHVSNARELWRYESVGEMTDNTRNARPWWFYAPAALQVALPWTPTLLFAVAAVIPRIVRRRKLLFAFLWYALAILFFSFVHHKKNSYLLPVMPAQTLIVTLGLNHFHRRRTLKWTLNFSIVFTLVTAWFFHLYLADKENLRSPRPVVAEVVRLLRENPEASVIPSELAAEASVYLPIDVRRKADAKVIYFVIDDRYGKFEATPAFINEKAPGLGAVEVRQVPFENRGKARWEIYAVRVK